MEGMMVRAEGWVGWARVGRSRDESRGGGLGEERRTQALALVRGLQLQVSTVRLERRQEVEMAAWINKPMPRPTTAQPLMSRPYRSPSTLSAVTPIPPSETPRM